MKVLIAYNRYRHRVHGEEAVVTDTERLLRASGVQVTSFIRSSEGLADRPLAKAVAGVAGLYNPRARRLFTKMLRQDKPDVVHAHNLYPWISPSVLLAARAAGVPVVMTVHHYGLTCPALTHFRDGAVCQQCVVKSEWECVRHNCRGSAAQSVAYALRNGLARRQRWFIDNVSVFIALSEFARQQLERCGIAAGKIVVRPNFIQVSQAAGADADADPADGAPVGADINAVSDPERGASSYVAYAGRLTYEKGVDLLCEAAVVTGLPVRIAGDTRGWPALAQRYGAKVTFCGVLEKDALADFYRRARFLVVPSRWWEVCPLVVLEAMNQGCPVLAADSGGLREMVDSGRTGLLFQSGSVEDLSRKMQLLWQSADLRAQLRTAARTRLGICYEEGGYIRDLLAIYQRAMAA